MKNNKSSNREEKKIEHREREKIQHEEEKKITHKKEKLVPYHKILLLQTKHDNLENQVKRLQAEFDNFQKRTNREMSEMKNAGKIEVMKSLLPILDEVDEAKKHVEDEGTIMLFENLRKVLMDNGLEEVYNKGKYNPELHEVVGTIKYDEKGDNGCKEEGKIVKIVRKGYMVEKTVLRPSMVFISKK